MAFRLIYVQVVCFMFSNTGFLVLRFKSIEMHVITAENVRKQIRSHEDLDLEYVERKHK